MKFKKLFFIGFVLVAGISVLGWTALGLSFSKTRPLQSIQKILEPFKFLKKTQKEAETKKLVPQQEAQEEAEQKKKPQGEAEKSKKLAPKQEAQEEAEQKKKSQGEAEKSKKLAPKQEAQEKADQKKKPQGEAEKSKKSQEKAEIKKLVPQQETQKETEQKDKAQKEAEKPKKLASQQETPEDSKKLTLSGIQKIHIKTHVKKMISPFPNKEEIAFIIGHYLLEEAKKQELLCPDNYELQNNYSLHGEISFLKVQKNTCVGEQAKEVYHLNKKLPVKKRDKENLILVYDQLMKWTLDIFLYPFLPGPLKTVPKEFTDLNLDKSCPSCSFEFEFNYKYIGNNTVDFNIKAFCRDRKNFLSKVKQDNYIINHWKCIKKHEQTKVSMKDIKKPEQTKK